MSCEGSAAARRRRSSAIPGGRRRTGKPVFHSCSEPVALDSRCHGNHSVPPLARLRGDGDGQHQSFIRRAARHLTLRTTLLPARGDKGVYAAALAIFDSPARCWHLAYANRLSLTSQCLPVGTATMHICPTHKSAFFADRKPLSASTF
jgi:hypothetical protein